VSHYFHSDQFPYIPRSPEISFAEYSVRASRTAQYPGDKAIEYLGLGLASEAGEVAGHVKKAVRDDSGVITLERKAAMVAELGDCLWYLAELSRSLGVTLNYVAMKNLEKLESRRDRGVIKGEGDER
jgi:NTP pyrophosphatase (non-canonical NTP hydrolase)